MKKRWLCVVCILVLLSGCMNKEAKEVFVTSVTPITENKFLYNPGTYRGEGNGYHGLITVEVTVSESKILYIDVLSHDEANYLIDIYGNPVEENQDEFEDVVEDETDENVNEDEGIVEEEIETEEVEILGAIDGLVNMIMLEQTTNVDAVTHATVTCDGLKEAISRALAEAML